MERMGLAVLLDPHFPTHGNWQGLGFGRVATIWLSSILSRGDHRLVHVEPWVAQRQFTLSHLSGEAVRAHELSDDRRDIVLRLLSDDQRWAAFEAALNPHLVRVYDLRTERVHVDSTSASASTSVSEEGLLQFGHSLDEGEFDEALERVHSGGQALSEVFREQEPGDPVLIAQGSEYNRPMSVSVEDTEREWTERRVVVRSVRHAESAQAALQARVAKAKEQVEALNQRGRGRKRFEDVAPLRQAVNAIVQRHRVEDFLWLRYDQQTTTRSVRASQDRPA